MAYPVDVVGGPDDYPVQVGSMLFTLVDAHRGYERAFNRWYERDHFYATLEGPYGIAARRWVATRELRALRWPKDDVVAKPYDAGAYLATYWILKGREKDWDEWGQGQAKNLYAHGRGFAERSHVHTVSYDAIGADYRDPDPVPVTLALHHDYDGLVAIWLDGRAGRDAAATLAELRKDVLPETLAGSSLESAASWTPAEAFRGSGRSDAPMTLGTPGGEDNRLCQLFFASGDVRGELDRVRRYTEKIEQAGIADVLLVAPFLRAVVGTDTYVDEIW